MVDPMLGRLFGSQAVQAVFGPRGRLDGMLRFEAALARVQARLGIVPAAAAEAIARHCDAGAYDPSALAEAAERSGNTAIPLVRELTRRVAADDEAAAGYVHWGATSQDAQDTGLVLQMRDGLAHLEATLVRVADAAAALAERHRGTLLAGRTWLQQALPVTFGLKAAGWLDGLTRSRARLAELRPRVLVLQFGGAAGTLASLGDQGPAVAQGLADELGLGLPALPWHTQRDRIAETGGALAVLVGSLGKIARDTSLLMQTEVGEVRESAAPGGGGSSSMPHKRNPVGAAEVLTAAVRAPGLAATLLTAMVQEHERGIGGWHAEWSALPELFDLAGGALEHTAALLEGLEVEPARMRANLDATQGLVMAEAVKMGLAPHLGGQRAYALVEQASRSAAEQQRPLLEVLAAEPEVQAALAPAALAALFDPAGYLGATADFIDRALAEHRRAPAPAPANR